MKNLEKPRIHKMNFGDEIEHELEKTEKVVIKEEPALSQKYHSRWLAIKLLEQDDEIKKYIKSNKVNETVSIFRGAS